MFLNKQIKKQEMKKMFCFITKVNRERRREWGRAEGGGGEEKGEEKRDSRKQGHDREEAVGRHYAVDLSSQLPMS